MCDACSSVLITPQPLRLHHRGRDRLRCMISRKATERERERRSQEMACYEVLEEEVSSVKPTAGGGGDGCCLYLSSLDLCWREAPYSSRVLLYDNVGAQQQAQEAMVSKLKGSLAQVLVAFYPAAGRMVSACPPAPVSAVRPSILCNGQGVEFIVARVNAPLSPLHWPLFPSLARHYAPGHKDQDLLPLLSVQVTKFVCGGLAVGISYSNVLTDGHSLWHLMNSWAECARDETISIQPYHNREVFMVENPSWETASQLCLPTCDMSKNEKIAPTTKMHSLLHVTPSMVQKMKEQAYEVHKLTNETSFSDYDSLCAFMWKHGVASQNSSKVDHSISNICVSGDMRFRMKSNLPRGYFGNSTIFAYASSYIGDTRKEPIGTFAKKIHEACKDCNEKRLWEIVNWLEIHENLFNADVLPWMVASLNVVSSPKFKVYNVDFGWGKPTAVHPSQVTNNRDMFLFPAHDGGIDICLSFSSPLVNQLHQEVNKLIS